jgi:hypothetical protein
VDVPVAVLVEVLRVLAGDLAARRAASGEAASTRLPCSGETTAD